MRYGRGCQRWASYGIRYAAILVGAVLFAFPIFWIVSTSFKIPNEYFANPPIWLPQHPTLSAYGEIFSPTSARALTNSLIMATLSTLLAILLGAPAAYSLVRFQTGGQSLAFWFLSQRFLPPIAVILPVFIFFRRLRWVDTYHGLILLYTVFNLPYVVWMLRSYFQDVPLEVEESALIDGASRWQALWHITTPLAAGGLIATGVFAFIFSWNEFLFALILTRAKTMTLPIALAAFFGSQSAFWGQASALSVTATAPIFALTLLFQRYLVRGLTLGAVK